MTQSTSALPAGVSHVTITCDKVAALLADGSDSGKQADGAPLNLDVEFIAPVDWERYPGSGIVMLDQPVRARVINGVLCDQLGTPSVGLIAPREGWTWTVRLLQGRKLRAEFPIKVEAAPEPQNLADIMIASALPGDAMTQGPSAYEVAVANGFVGTEAQWLASLKGADGAGSMARGTATDLNALYGSNNAGTWITTASTTGTPGSGLWNVIVSSSTASGRSTQIATDADSGQPPETWVRNGSSSSNWSAWKRIDVDAGAVRFDSAQSLTVTQREQILANTNASGPRNSGVATSADISTFVNPSFNGIWYVAGAAAGTPTTAGGTLQVNFPGTSTGHHIFIEHTGVVWTRAYANGWKDWTRLGVLQDTEWRNITPATLPAQLLAGSKVLIRRVGARVTVRFELMWAASAVPGSPFDLGSVPNITGFRQASGDRPTLTMTDTSVNTTDTVAYYLNRYLRLMFRIGAAGLSTSIPDSTKPVMGELSYYTTDAFPTPTTYPGTPN